MSEVGGSLSWGAFASFVKNLDYTSALWKSTHPEEAEWVTTLKTNVILADIYDLLAQMNANLVGGFQKKRAKKTKPYPRPWSKNQPKKLGRGAMPKNELREWMNKKREEAKRGKRGTR